MSDEPTSLSSEEDRSDAQNRVLAHTAGMRRLYEIFASERFLSTAYGALAGAFAAFLMVVVWSMGAPAVDEIDLLPLETRLRSVETSLSAVDQKLRAGGGEHFRSELSLLIQRIEALEAVPKSASSPPVVSAVSLHKLALLSSLDLAVREGRSFQLELQAFLTLFGKDLAVDLLKAQAHEGVSSVVMLYSAFVQLKPVLSRLSQSPSGSSVDGFMRLLGHFISVQWVGENFSSRLDLIELHLAQGRLAEALRVFSELPENIQSAAKGWFFQAEKTHNVRIQLEGISRQILEDIIADHKAVHP